jgi:predicted glycosyltransferase involved in capsule biosynthesis
MQKEKLSLIIPYRRRLSHLLQFLFCFEKHMEKYYSHVTYNFYIIEQYGDYKFNRGKLLNVGFDISKDKCDYFCFHDVDMLPVSESCNYSLVSYPTHMAKHCTQYNYIHPYWSCFGGVTLFDKENYIKCQGFSNEMWGWGYEDDDLFSRVNKFEITIDNRDGYFYTFDHERDEADHYGNYEKSLSCKKDDYYKDGLLTLNYEIINNKKIKFPTSNIITNHYLVKI